MNLGLGVMIGIMGGNKETVEAIKASLNKTIAIVYLDQDDNRLIFEFTDNTTLRIWDGGQSCCESRYMTTDDNLSEHYGATLLDFELKSADVIQGSDVHEIQFLDVKTSNGVFQMVNHNEHNGYYGGFYIQASN